MKLLKKFVAGLLCMGLVFLPVSAYAAGISQGGEPDTTLTTEEVQDIAGGMWTGNTETFITMTYQDGDGTVDAVVPVLDEDNLVSDSATDLATQQSIKAYVDGLTGANESDPVFLAETTFAALNTRIADKTLVNEEDVVTWDALQTFGTNISFLAGLNHVIDVIDAGVSDADGGDLTITAGDGGSGGAGIHDGGDVIIDSGVKAGAGTNGSVYVKVGGVTGATFIDGHADFTSDIGLSTKLHRIADENTYIDFTGVDRLRFFAGNLDMIDIRETAQNYVNIGNIANDTDVQLIDGLFVEGSSRNVSIMNGDLQIAGTSIIDTSRNIADSEAGSHTIGTTGQTLLKGTHSKTRRMCFSTRLRPDTATDARVGFAGVIQFTTGVVEAADTMNVVLPEIDLSTTNPILRFYWRGGTTNAGVGTETVRVQLEIRYKADGETIGGAIDETLTLDIDLPTGITFVGGSTDFTLDRTLMASEDSINVRVTRLGTHANDDYGDDWNLAQIYLIYEGTGGV